MSAHLNPWPPPHLRHFRITITGTDHVGAWRCMDHVKLREAK